MQVLLFEDDAVDQLRPLALARPAFSVSCGATRLLDLLQTAGFGPLSCRVRPHLQPLLAQDHPNAVAPLAANVPTLVVNARLVPSQDNLAALRQLIAHHTSASILAGHSVAAAWLTHGASTGSAPSSELPADPVAAAAHLPVREDLKLDLFDFPHDLLRRHPTLIQEHLSRRIQSADLRQLADGVFAAEGVALSNFVVFDTRNGPIVLEAQSHVGPFSSLHGPLWIGPSARVNEHASLRNAASIGPFCKVGGEVDCAIFESFSNKQHHGFLGHSYVGSWVNLGAGTSNSNLKNTYGTVNVQFGPRRVSTGMQLLGCFFGDYAKSAINTSIFTGKTIGVGSMLYGFVTGHVPSFVNFAPSLGQVTAIPPEVLVAAQARMMARRGQTQRDCDRDLIIALHRLTQDERAPLEPLSQEPPAW